MRLAERVVCCFLISLGGVYAYGIQQIQGRHFTSNEIGPTAFPWLMVSLLIALSVLLLVRSRAVPLQGGEEIVEENKEFANNFQLKLIGKVDHSVKESIDQYVSSIISWIILVILRIIKLGRINKNSNN